MVLTRTLLFLPVYRNSRFLVFVRQNKSITGYKAADDALTTVTGGKIHKWLDAYENIVGLTEVKQAQSLVTEAEASYRTIQENRRSTQQQLGNVQAKIKVLAQDIEKCQRGTDTYIELVTRENEIIKDEKQILDSLYELEELEKHHFGLLSSAVRESHEKERTRAERVKYWGLSASVIGAFLGIMGTTVNNYLRMKELRKIVSSSSEQTLELYKSVNEQYGELRTTLSEVKSHAGVPISLGVESKLNQSKSKDDTAVEKPGMAEVVKLLQKQETLLRNEIDSIKKLVKVKVVQADADGNGVFAVSDLETVLNDTEKRLEWKMKLQAIGIVTLIYAAGAVTVPILVSLFSGGS